MKASLFYLPSIGSRSEIEAGMAGMRRRRFVTANVASAFVWAPVHIYPAALAGLSLGRLREGDWQSGILWGAILLTCAAAAWGLHRLVIARVR